jgi:hypothetical protein
MNLGGLIMWYDYNNILSRNAMLNFILTNRGGGKTYGFKKKAINNFLKKNEQFMYVRRYKTEFKKIQTFFDDIKIEFPDHEFKCNKNFAFIDDKVCGYFVPLSTANNEKSTAYPNVTLMGFDEFIIDKKNQRYLPDEPILLDGLIETVVRQRDNLTVVCLANNVTLSNPYFEHWNIFPDFTEGIKTYERGEKICVELRADKEFIEQKIKTRWGKLNANTRYGEHAIYNKSLKDDDSFIMNKKPSNCKFMFSIILNSEEVGIWLFDDMFFCDKKIINTSPLRYALQKDDLTLDNRMIDKINSSSMIYVFKNAFKNGRVFYKNKYIKSTIFDILRYIGIR